MSVKHLKTKDVAEKLGYSVDHFRKAIKNSPSFPKPKQIKLANGGLSHPFWDENDIEQYLMKLAA